MDVGGRFCWFKQKCIRDKLKDTVNCCVLTIKLLELMGDELIQLGEQKRKKRKKKKHLRVGVSKHGA